MTNELKFSNLWENLKLFLNKAKVGEREAFKKILEGSNHEMMQSKEFQQLYVETAIAIFAKNPAFFDYTEAEAGSIRLMLNTGGRQKFAKSVTALLQGQYNANGTFFGRQAEFKWRRSPIQNGLAAIASSNTTRPWFCTAVHLPGYHIRSESGAALGGLFNHNWGFAEAKNEWYATYFSRQKTLRFIKTWEFENIKQAQKHYEKLYLKIVYSDSHLDYRARIFENNGEITSLTI
jgi:hypothetical protein